MYTEEGGNVEIEIERGGGLGQRDMNVDGTAARYISNYSCMLA